jgi:hypothetical protein
MARADRKKDKLQQDSDILYYYIDRKRHEKEDNEK